MTKRILIAITAVLLASTLTTLNKQEEYNPDNIPTHIHAKFLNWRMTFNKMYNTPREYIYRVQIFYENYLKFKEIMQDNSLLYKAELNKFADLSKEEFLSKWGGYMRTYRFSNQEKVEEYRGREITSIPRKIDWREKNCVTEISNQNNCASSWAFSTAAILECYYYKKEDQLYKLSPQQMIDCIDTSENYGCKGGKPETGLNYAKEKKVCLEFEYPYTGKAEKCKDITSRFEWKPIKEFKRIKRLDERAFEAAVTQGVISVTIDAYGLMLYKSGIINENKSSSSNHVVAVVGFDEQRVSLGGKDFWKKYWILKNSWGKDWGENGYFRVERGGGEVENAGVLGIYLEGYIITE